MVHISGEPISRTALALEFVKRFPKYTGLVREREPEEFGFLDSRSIQVHLDSSMIREKLGTSFVTSDRIIDQYLGSI